MKYAKIAFVVLTILSLTACGDANPYISPEGAGFWGGVWDGATQWCAFIFSLFGGDFNIYEVHNNGNWYNFGYLIGLIGVIKLVIYLFQLLVFLLQE